MPIQTDINITGVNTQVNVIIKYNSASNSRFTLNTFHIWKPIFATFMIVVSVITA